MKQKHTITIADIQMNIITDEAPETVETVVGILDRKMREIHLKSGNRCPKTEAALLCALDYCAEKVKADKRIRNLEAQISLYDANLRRLREENTTLAAHLAKAVPQEETEEIKEKQEEPAVKAVPVVEKPAEKPVEKASEKSAPEGTSGKLRQLELMLRGIKENDNQ